MLRSLCRFSLLAFLGANLLACSSGNFSDLDQYMAEIKAKPKGELEPIPVFRPYESFVYSATILRAPFTKPVKVKEITRVGRSTNIKPDENRTKEFLEGVNIESMTMVGTMEQSGILWVLMNDGTGGVHRVRKGNYLGRNHGKIVEATENYVTVIEIVPNGLDGWVERPRSIKMEE